MYSPERMNPFPTIILQIPLSVFYAGRFTFCFCRDMMKKRSLF